MASFPDLRPRRRSAKTECTAASRSRTPVLLAVSAALLFTAWFAVSELATLRGAKAHDASAFLTRELGPPLDRASLVRRPAHGVTVAIHRDGYVPLPRATPPATLARVIERLLAKPKPASPAKRP